MAGIKGLKKGDRPELEKQAEDFIKGVEERTKQLSFKKKTRVFQRYNFSLTEEISDEIDRLTLISREFRTSRSDIIKVAIKAFSNLSPSIQAEEIKKIFNSK